MKKLLAATTALLALAAPAQAGQNLPILFAAKFCEAVTLGVIWDDALRYAHSESYLSTAPDSPVGSNGYRIDVTLSTNAAYQRCPGAWSAAYRAHEQAEARKQAEARRAQPPVLEPANTYVTEEERTGLQSLYQRVFLK